MRALKVLVVVMGVLLVGGTAALVFAIIDRARHRVAEPAPVAAGHAFASTVELPPGARIIGTEEAGERLIVRVALAEGGEALILIDARNGMRLGTIELRPGAPGSAKR